jgi:hypothetical protein
LAGETLQQCDLFVGERSDFLPINENNANECIILNHRHANCGSRTAKPRWRPPDSVSGHIDSMFYLFRCSNFMKYGARQRAKASTLPFECGKFARSSDFRC